MDTDGLRSIRAVAAMPDQRLGGAEAVSPPAKVAPVWVALALLLYHILIYTSEIRHGATGAIPRATGQRLCMVQQDRGLSGYRIPHLCREAQTILRASEADAEQ